MTWASHRKLSRVGLKVYQRDVTAPINSYIYLSLNQTGLRDSVNVFSQISLYKSNSGIRIGEFDLKVVSV